MPGENKNTRAEARRLGICVYRVNICALSRLSRVRLAREQRGTRGQTFADRGCRAILIASSVLTGVSPGPPGREAIVALLTFRLGGVSRVSLQAHSSVSRELLSDVVCMQARPIVGLGF